MIPGFNHNVRYKGILYHVQTEDSGVDNPVITTLLYKSGTILSSKRTSYSDILNSDKMDEVVKEIMKEQHKMMLYDLKNGVFDGEKEVPKVEIPEDVPEKIEELETTREELDFGDGVISEKSLDEVILDYLAAEESGSED
ncbi:MAG: hypothetical protein JW984_10680 [Deltaproteobacteria bacterium]|uniref:Uncharacterized protein n=1 Tax=Candidatus Zymogenus saltonus TaxID=2844893 RepID=A0A9D8PQ42_9DELT|nr:hypothetical protein [Candidatus Zymogenus saltonus]